MGILNRLSGMADLASEHGEMVDHLLEFVHWFMLILFIGWTAFLVLAICRFRAKKNPRANYHGVRNHATTHIEVGVIITEVVLLLGFAYPLWGRRVDEFPDSGSDIVRVRAIGEQFRWIFHYAGADGKFGRIDPELMSSTELIGLDHSDPNAKDDFTSVQELVLPINRRVIIGVTSKDVIHNLSLIPMRISQDATPGTEAHVWFTPQKKGTWDIVCGQLCGANHANMRATLEVKSDTGPQSFDLWFKEKSPAQAPAPGQPATPAPPAAAPAAPGATPSQPAATPAQPATTPGQPATTPGQPPPPKPSTTPPGQSAPAPTAQPPAVSPGSPSQPVPVPPAPPPTAGVKPGN
jgi:cytochrome c oxidase subunit II